MRFWDSSALISLVLPESRSRRVASLLPSQIAFWWATPIECEGVLVRAGRSGKVGQSRLLKAKGVLDLIFHQGDEVSAWEAIRDHARRLIAIHPIRAADALQLAAALDWCGGNPNGESFVCLDDRLRGAAALEGFRVLPYSEEVNEARVEYAVL